MVLSQKKVVPMLGSFAGSVTKGPGVSDRLGKSCVGRLPAKTDRLYTGKGINKKTILAIVSKSTRAILPKKGSVGKSERSD